MKNLFVLWGICAVCFAGKAAGLSDTTVMTIAGKPVSIDEFVFIARKNSGVDLSDKKSLDAYVDLFKLFKLKVADAEAEGLDQSEAFKNEYELYQRQLIDGYLSDKAGEEAVLRQAYDRYQESLELSHILFRLPEKTLTKDTAAVYAKAFQAYRRIVAGEEIEAVGKELMEADKDSVGYEYMRSFLPMKTLKAFEDAAYSLAPGSVSVPVRSALGYHIIKLHRKNPNPGLVKVAHILIPFPADSVKEKDVWMLAHADDIYSRLQEGEDFLKVAEEYSAMSGKEHPSGELPFFGIGEMVEPFEKASFALVNPGDLSKPVKTRFGYHIIRLIEKKALPTLAEKSKDWRVQMQQGEWNFAFYRAFDERAKEENCYRFYPEAYAELQALCTDHFPNTPSFFEQTRNMQRVLFQLDGKDYRQDEFAEYLIRNPYSTKTYAGDFMREVYDQYVREIATVAERNHLFEKYPEIPLLMQEYRDGILLFEISNAKVWSHPAADQGRMEAEWVKSLHEKYPVSINWKLLKKMNK